MYALHLPVCYRQACLIASQASCTPVSMQPRVNFCATYLMQVCLLKDLPAYNAGSTELITLYGVTELPDFYSAV